MKQGDNIFVLEIKGDEELADPSPDNSKKHEYAMAHFERLNQWLENEGIAARYQFNMLSLRSFNVFFQNLRSGELVGFRSELDVVMSRAAKSDA